jgi:uncharacterized glyoxalase superfamily protein PhnB
MNILALSIVRHTRNYETMVHFYREILEMEVVQSWDEPANRGTLLSPGKSVGRTVIEIIELGEEAVPGVKPVNVVLSIEVDNVDRWHDQLIKVGVTIARGLEDAPWGHRSFGIDDPDGFRIWFYEDIRAKTQMST